METTTHLKAKPILYASFCDGKGPALQVCDRDIEKIKTEQKFADFNTAVAKIVHKYMKIPEGSDFKMHLADKDHIRVTVIDKNGNATGSEFKLAKDAKGDWSDESGSLKPKAANTTKYVALIFETIMTQANKCKSHKSGHKKNKEPSSSKPTSSSSLISNKTSLKESTSSTNSENSNTETDSDKKDNKTSTKHSPKLENKESKTSNPHLPIPPEKKKKSSEDDEVSPPPIETEKKESNKPRQTTPPPTVPNQFTTQNANEDVSKKWDEIMLSRPLEEKSSSFTPTPQFLNPLPTNSLFSQNMTGLPGSKMQTPKPATPIILHTSTTPAKSLDDIDEDEPRIPSTKKEDKAHDSVSLSSQPEKKKIKKKKQNENGSFWDPLTNLFGGRKQTSNSTLPPKTQTDSKKEEWKGLPDEELWGIDGNYPPERVLQPKRDQQHEYSSSYNNDESNNQFEKNDNRLKTTSTQEIQDSSSSDKKAPEPIKKDTVFFDSFSSGLEQNSTHYFDKK